MLILIFIFVYIFIVEDVVFINHIFFVHFEYKFFLLKLCLYFSRGKKVTVMVHKTLSNYT